MVRDLRFRRTLNHPSAMTIAAAYTMMSILSSSRGRGFSRTPQGVLLSGNRRTGDRYETLFHGNPRPAGDLAGEAGIAAHREQQGSTITGLSYFGGSISNPYAQQIVKASVRRSKCVKVRPALYPGWLWLFDHVFPIFSILGPAIPHKALLSTLNTSDSGPEQSN